jgi:hypothetical protein
MTRWLMAARQALPSPDKTDKSDNTLAPVPEARTSIPAFTDDRQAPAPVLSEKSVLSDAQVSPARAEPKGGGRYPHGMGVNGFPLTWTGKPVSHSDWARLSTWEKDGSTGQVWNGLTGAWEAEGGQK